MEAANSSETWESTDKNTRCRKPESQYLTHLSPDSTEAPFIWVQKVTYRHDKTVIQSTEGNLQTSQDSYPKYRR